jgi:hypothetical protein
MILTFTPAMFAAARRPVESDRKTITRRLQRRPTDKPPYGPDGTRLPAATTWAVEKRFDALRPSQIDPAQAAQMGLWFQTPGEEKPAWAGKSRPARFIPKSLYSLCPQAEILSTRAERLHEITVEDAEREGVNKAPWLVGDDPVGLAEYHAMLFPKDFDFLQLPITRYYVLWDQINANRHEGRYAAAQKPAVWRLHFRLI